MSLVRVLAGCVNQSQNDDLCIGSQTELHQLRVTISGASTVALAVLGHGARDVIRFSKLLQLSL